MTTIISYLYQYVKTNDLTTYFLIFMTCLIGFKYLPFKISLRPSKALWIVIAIGFILRLAWLGFSSHQPIMQWNKEHMLENDIINVQAMEMTQGIWFHDAEGKPTGRRPIGYPVALGIVYKIFGIHLWAAWAFNLILYLTTVIFLERMARILFGAKIAFMVAIFFAVNPISIYSVKLLTDEHLFLPLWYGGLYFLLSELSDRKMKYPWLWYGLFFGFSTMTRTHSIFMPFVVGLAYGFKKYSLRKIISGILLTGFVMQLVNLPWVVRNYKVWGELVLYTPTGHFVYSQVNSTAGPEGGGHIPKKGEPGYSEELAKAMAEGNEARIHKIANQKMKEWILAHPFQFGVMGISRLLFFMNWNRKDGVWPLWYQYYPGSFDPKKPLPQAQREFFEEYAFGYYYTLLFGCLMSLIFISRNWKQLPENTRIGLLVILSCFAFWFAEHMIIYPLRKYRYPLEPLMLIPTCYFFYFLAVNFRVEEYAANLRSRFKRVKA